MQAKLDALEKEIERLILCEEGAKIAFSNVVETKNELKEAQKKTRNNLDNAHNLITKQSNELGVQAKELAALRGFAKWVYMESLKTTQHNYYAYALKVNGLIDADGKPTPLLTGVKNETADGSRLE